MHDHDGRLPDLSENGAGDTVAEMRALLEDARALESALPPSSPAFSAHDASADRIDAIDLRLARGFLEIELREFESLHFRRGNPSLYAGEAVFGVLSLLLTDFAPLAERLEAATARMDAIPPFLEQARATLERAPVEWTDRALDECKGARLLFTDGVRRFLAETGRSTRSFLAAADRAAAAFAAYASWLRSDLRAHPTEDDGCGEEMLDLYLRAGHTLDMDVNGVLALARASLAAAESELAKALVALGLPDVLAECQARVRSGPPPARSVHRPLRLDFGGEAEARLGQRACGQGREAAAQEGADVVEARGGRQRSPVSGSKRGRCAILNLRLTRSGKLVLADVAAVEVGPARQPVRCEAVIAASGAKACRASGSGHTFPLDHSPGLQRLSGSRLRSVPAVHDPFA